ncbi:MAG: DUF3526 domain-containing protein [Pseudomonadota bacterium]
MTVFTPIATKDWQEFIRDRRLLIMAVLTMVLALSAIITAFANVRAYETNRIASEGKDRITWENQGERNPHSAAHFATWAFRPQTALSILEPGVTPYAGAAIWMEAHHQNGARARAIDDSPIAFDMGRFSVAWILQIVVPLLICIVAAGLVARERERGTLHLLLVGGARADGLLPSKLQAISGIAAVVSVPVVAAGILASLLAGPIDPIRLFLWVASYTVFLGIVAMFATAVSAMTNSVASSMLALIGVWCVAVLLAPRAGVALAEGISPTPSPEAFWDTMDKELADAPNPFADDTFEKEVLEEYGVATAEELPVSLAGLKLDQSERNGDVVFDRSFGQLADTYAEQRTILRIASLISPLPALQNISGALAGTDGLHQLAFQEQAEAHRRKVIGALNRDMAENAVGQDWDYRADETLWRQTEDFQFTPPNLLTSLQSIWPDLGILGLWAVAAFAFIRRASHSLERSFA